MTPGLLDLLKLAVLSAPAPLPDWTQVALSAWFPWATPWDDSLDDLGGIVESTMIEMTRQTPK